MKAGSLKALFASLGLSASSVLAQSPMASPARPPAVTLGRPVVPGRAVPGPAPASSTAIQPVSFQTAVPAPAPMPPLPAVSLPEDEPTLFAVDRAAVLPVGQTFVPTPQSFAGGWVEGELPAETVVDAPEVVSSGEAGSRPFSRLYVGGEYLLWWTKNDRIPALATTSGITDPNQIMNNILAGNPPGRLGDPQTSVLFGDNLRRDAQSGFRVYGGYWLNDDRTWAIESSYFLLGQRSDRFVASSSAFPVIARPFFNVNPNSFNPNLTFVNPLTGQQQTGVFVPFGEAVQFVAIPTVLTGTLTIDAPSELGGFDVNLRKRLCCGCKGNLDLLVGGRYLNLTEGLHITEDITVLPPMNDPRSRLVVMDNFDTRNRFYGGQVGLAGEITRGRWFVGGRGLLALGVTHQELRINGSQTAFFADPNVAPQTNAGGLLAVPNANIGRFTQDRFAVVPEIGVRVGYQLTDRLRAYVGYNFLYWSSVLRPGDQIDRNLDAATIPNFLPPGSNVPPTGLPVPTVPLKETSYWAQGLTFGLQFNW